MKKAISILLAGVALSGFALQAAAHIVWKPKTGRVLTYKLTSSANLGSQGQLHYDATITHTIKDIAKDGNITVDEKQSDVKMTLGDQDLSSGVPTDTVSTTVLKPNGDIVSATSSNPDDENHRMDEALSLTYPDHPLKSGESWKVGRKANAALKSFTSQATFTYAGNENVGNWDCYKISVDYKETDAPLNLTGTGTVWLSIEDGEMVKASYVLKNVPMGQDQPPIDTMNASIVREG